MRSTLLSPVKVLATPLSYFMTLMSGVAYNMEWVDGSAIKVVIAKTAARARWRMGRGVSVCNPVR